MSRPLDSTTATTTAAALSGPGAEATLVLSPPATIDAPEAQQFGTNLPIFAGPPVSQQPGLYLTPSAYFVGAFVVSTPQSASVLTGNQIQIQGGGSAPIGFIASGAASVTVTLTALAQGALTPSVVQ